jgi:NTE family protein
MSGSRRVAVTETAAKTTALALRSLRGGDTALPGRSRRKAARPRRQTASKRRRRAA